MGNYPPNFQDNLSISNNIIVITEPIKYPRPENKASFNLSFQVFDSTIKPTNGNDRNGPMNAKNIIPR